MAKRKSNGTGKGYMPVRETPEVYCPTCEAMRTTCRFPFNRKTILFCELCTTDLVVLGGDGSLKPISTKLRQALAGEVSIRHKSPSNEQALNHVTDAQYQIMKHALGLEGEGRNVFYLCPMTELGVSAEVHDMVESGYMEFSGVLETSHECYAVTDLGKLLLDEYSQLEMVEMEVA